jgi:2-keto-3-deoxy-L-rhamnonate aldolase RhmA
MRTFTDLIKAGETKDVLLGTWVHMGAPEVIDILGTCTFDFLILDTQHSALSMQTIENMARACAANTLVPIVRVADNIPHLICQALDLGAAAVVVPMISTRAAAEAAVRAARFGPRGERSACPMVRAAGHYTTDWRPFAKRCDTETGVIMLVETPEGVANCEEIAKVPGIVALLAGPFDLAVAMGHGNNMRHPDVSNAMTKLLGAAQRAGIPSIIPIFAPTAEECRDTMQEWQNRGVRIFTVGGDTLFLAHYARGYVAQMRSPRARATAVPRDAHH